MAIMFPKRRPFFLLICLLLTGSCWRGLLGCASDSACHTQREGRLVSDTCCSARVVSRQLEGDGAHRILHTSLFLSCAINSSSGIRVSVSDESDSTRVMLRVTEGLPSGLFADTFELERMSLPGETKIGHFECGQRALAARRLPTRCHFPSEEAVQESC